MLRDATMRASKPAPSKRRSAPKPTRETRTRVRLDVDERRTQLLELGLAEFGTRTYDEVSIDRIAQAAGISKGLLYHYFPTKRAFYRACVRQAADRLLARMTPPEDMPPLERLRGGLDSYLEYVRAHGAAFATLMRSGAFADRELGVVIAETRATLLERLTSGLAGFAPTDGEPSPLLRLALEGFIGLAEAMSIAWVEACVKAEANPQSPPPPSKEEVRDLLARSLVALVQGGS
jgi:AcrR family transcriptional regulator